MMLNAEFAMDVRVTNVKRRNNSNISSVKLLSVLWNAHKQVFIDLFLKIVIARSIIKVVFPLFKF